MAYYEHLPIYRKAMETAIYFETIVRNFSRYNKYSLGAEMREKSLLNRYDFLKYFFSFDGWKIIPKYKIPARIPSLKLQYRYFKTIFAEDVIFFKKGKYYEFFEDDRKTALQLGLKKINRYFDHTTTYGFPIWLEKSFAARIIQQGRSLTVITEGERYLTGIKERFPKYRIVSQVQTC